MNWDPSIRILGEDHSMILKTRATTKTSWNTKRLFQRGRMMMMHQKQKKFACRPCELFEYLLSVELRRANWMPQPTMEHPSDEQAPTESTDDLDPLMNFIRRSNCRPAYIEYRDGIIYRREPDQTEEQIDSDLQQAAIGATCMVCHRCHPRVRIQYFVAPSDGPRYIIIYRTLARHQSNGVWHKNKLETTMRILILNGSSRCVSSKMRRL